MEKLESVPEEDKTFSVSLAFTATEMKHARYFEALLDAKLDEVRRLVLAKRDEYRGPPGWFPREP